jgi:hypothetical protein
MKRIVITCCFLYCYAALSAQQKEVSDSLYFYAQERNEMKMVFNSATQLSVLALPRTGMATLSLLRETGDYRRAQQAAKTSDATFYTAGTSKLGRFNLAGSFLFSKVWEDSLSYTMKGLSYEGDPYYYYAARAGNYNRQNYNMMAIVSYQLLKNKLLLSTGIDYRYHWTTRYVDPRPGVTDFRLMLRPEITYKIKQHAVGLGLIWGYGQEKTNITYKNRNNSYNEKDSAWVVYLNRGYGYIKNMRSPWNRMRDDYGFNISYAGQWEHWQVRTTGEWCYLKERNSFARSASNEFDYQPFSTWKKSTYSVQLLAQHQRHAIHQQLQLGGQYIRGLDQDEYDVMASNYSYRKQHIDAGWIIRKNTNKRITKEWGVQLSYDDRTQIDALADHALHYRYIQPGLSGTLYAQAVQGNRIRLGISPSIRLPLQNTLTVPSTQENVFTRGVVYPDYYYWAATTLLTNMEAGWTSSTLLKQMKTGVTISAAMENNLQMPAIEKNTGFIPGRNRLSVSIAVNLYF